MSVKHKAKALAIHCIDFRFQTIIEEDLKERGLAGLVDRISVPGASKDFDVVDRFAKLSLQLHDPDQIIIYEHEDCGAYGENNSEEAHRTNAQKLKAHLIKLKPEIKVTILFVTFNRIKEI
jgi:carbonic anhydrase